MVKCVDFLCSVLLSVLVAVDVHFHSTAFVVIGHSFLAAMWWICTAAIMLPDRRHSNRGKSLAELLAEPVSPVEQFKRDTMSAKRAERQKDLDKWKESAFAGVSGEARTQLEQATLAVDWWGARRGNRYLLLRLPGHRSMAYDRWADGWERVWGWRVTHSWWPWYAKKTYTIADALLAAEKKR